MRAPLLLPLLLLVVSSQNVTNASPEGTQTTTTPNTSKMAEATSTRNPGSPPATSAMPHTTVQETKPTSKPGNPASTSVTSPTAVQGTSPTSNQQNSLTTTERSFTTVQGTTPTKNPVKSSPTPTTSPHLPQHISSSGSSGASTATPAAASSVPQQTTSPPASLGSSAGTTAASSVPIRVSSTPATTGGLGAASAAPPSIEAQGSQPSDQPTSTTTSTGVPTSSPPSRPKDHSAFPPTSVTKQLQPSPSSPVEELASSTKPGSIDTSVTPFGGAISPTTSKASLSLPPGGINKVSHTTTVTTLGTDQSSHDARSVSTTPASTDQAPASARPSAPALGDQTASSSPGHLYPNTSFQNKVICKDQVQNNWPTMYLKEAKTCAAWRTASINVSFFESFCSTGQHAFNASRETCTVLLTSHEPHSQHWAVRAVVHLPLDPEKVLEELKKKDKLEELGIVNVTYDKLERDMIINDEFSTPLVITIVTLAGSLLLIAAIYGCCHQRFSQKKDQHIHPDLPGFDDGHVALIFNRLTEELQTMENGYHDNPTLEVMETSSEMQEKKVNLNGELGDSWIVPLDTLMKEDLEEEEDTHL
ncbi:podocalyxin isoform X2 [Phalacrocorax aristotelis]|uniref:podocalyxin isoform X2 n=1 Tax=Phalacrocorax aristotelis TaxID=126867 RepID=UPI003F4B67D9